MSRGMGRGGGMPADLPPTPVERPQFAATRDLLPYLWPRGRPDMKIRVVLAVLALLLAKAAMLTVPLFYKQAVDALGAKGGAAATAVLVPVGLIVAYGVARLAGQAMGELRDAIFSRVAQHATRAAGLDVFRHLHRLSLRFHLERRTGALARAIERGVQGIQFLLSTVLFSIVPTLIEMLLVAGVLWQMYDWRFAAVTLATVGTYVAFTIRVSEMRVIHRREMNARDQEAGGRAMDSLLNYETVKYFGAETREAGRYDQALAAYEVAAVRSQLSLSALNVGQAVIIAGGLVSIMLLAAGGIADGEMTVGDFVAVNAYLIQLYVPLNVLGFVYRQLRQALTDMETMFALAAVQPDVADRPDAPALAVAGGEIRFQAVDFGYDPRRPILKGLDFTAPAGATVAIVGPSGAGKSTISRLMFRFFDPDGGAILIDGQDLRAVTQASLRDAVGMVPQDPVLFNDTLGYNIAYGRTDATTDEIMAAIERAALGPLVASLPDGLDSRVGERGLKLSGGEKQRVAIARALLKDPPILIFDEATSALDTRTEALIRDGLATAGRGRTMLVIAHRLSTVVDADLIVVLDDGRVVEQGRHEALVAAGGLYARLWARQSAEPQTPPEPTPPEPAPSEPPATSTADDDDRIIP
ncbi:ABC transporter ATP-binding protein/permease [Tistrella sp. BH-R2-4]|uniref:ABC transporter ATP-binding protein/permease n=1 Tax=Tistrella arctica TaxID=3133430 RepID=A0ABU9YMV8_9PROT